MATTKYNITQLRRIVFRKYTNETWEVFTLEPEELGDDTVMTFNIAPKKIERNTAAGTTSAPVPGTFDELTASVTFLPSTWYTVGKALQNWTAATYTDAATGEGQVVGGTGEGYCDDSDYVSVIAQGLCDDGSATDIEFTRCLPSLDDDIEVGSSDAVEITLNLHPQIYNATYQADDGYPNYTYRLGVENTESKTRLNVTSGKYEDA